MRSVGCVFVAACAVLVVGGCATTKQPPRIAYDLDEEPVGPRGTRCGRPVPLQRGAMPDGAVASVRYTLSASSPVPLAELEAVLRKSAGKVCADGVAVLQAIEDADGSGGVSAVTAVAWINGEDGAGSPDGTVDGKPDGSEVERRPSRPAAHADRPQACLTKRISW